MKLSLNRPISFLKNAKKRFQISLLFSLYIYVFLYIFTPFEIRTITSNIIIYLFGFFLITFAVLFLSFFLLPKICKEWFTKWTLKKLLFFSLVNFFIISILNWIYHDKMLSEFSESTSWITFFFRTLSVGIIPFIFLMIYIKNIKSLKMISKTILKKRGKKVIFLSLNKKESFALLLSQLLAIKSEGNYVKIYFIEKELLSQKLIHNSLTNIEKQFKKEVLIVRCHRSFIVNCYHGYIIKGNKRNYNLYLKNLTFSIPVSRSFPKETLEKLLFQKE